MEEEKSRVILYAKLRQKIENIDAYSFNDNDIEKKHLPQNNNFKDNNDIKEDVFKPRIKKNTLSLTIDELIKEHNEYNAREKHKEIKRKFSKKVRTARKENTKNIIIWASVVALTVAFIIFLIILFIKRGL